jgi:hypothetical protein
MSPSLSEPNASSFFFDLRNCQVELDLRNNCTFRRQVRFMYVHSLRD